MILLETRKIMRGIIWECPKTFPSIFPVFVVYKICGCYRDAPVRIMCGQKLLFSVLSKKILFLYGKFDGSDSWIADRSRI